MDASFISYGNGAQALFVNGQDFLPKVTGVLLTPDNAVLTEGVAQHYLATVQGDNNPSQEVSWSTDLGQVTVQGDLMPPTATNAVQTGHLTATSVLDPNQKAVVSFTVKAKEIVVTPPDNPDPVDPPVDPVPHVVKGTLVEFEFITPEGKVLANGDFDVRLKAADFSTSYSGVVMPRPVVATTDIKGKYVMELMPCDTLYIATMYDPESEAGLSYKFYVPEVAPGTIVRLQDLVVAGELPHLPYDQEALLIILKAKADAVAAAAQATATIAALKGPDGAKQIGYGNTTVAAALDSKTGGNASGGGTSGTDGKTIRYGTSDPANNLGVDGDFYINTTTHVIFGPKLNIWPAGTSMIGPKGDKGDEGDTGTGGGSSDFTPEVVLEPTANGEIILDRAKGKNFLIKPTQNIKLMNPVGFRAGEEIKIIIRQDIIGSRLMSYDTQYAPPGAQEPKLSTAPFAVDKLILDVTTGPNNLEYLVTPMFSQYSTITSLARIGAKLFYKMGGPDGQGALNLIQPNDVVYIIRNGAGPEVTGTIVGTSDATRPKYTIAGVSSNGERPTLKLLPDTRPAFNKALINLEGNLTVEIRDLKLTGARNSASDARGIALNQSSQAGGAVQYVTVRNVEITNCNNGILTGNQTMHGSLDIYDTLIDNCGIGGPDADNSHGTGSSIGYVHNIYMGDTDAPFNSERSTYTNSQTGHNIKTRSAKTTLKQVKTYGAINGRELELPNGGLLLAENCEFWKPQTPSQGNLVGIGEEGVDVSRAREYIFRNVRFRNDIAGEGRDVTFVLCKDPTVKMRFIDCEFIGDLASRVNNSPSNYTGMTTKDGIRYYPGCEPIFELTGGPIGPILPVGYFPVAMTPVVG